MQGMGVPLVVALILLVTFAGPAQAGCGGSIQGHLYVPRPQGAPHNLTGVETLHAARAVYHFEEFPPGPNYLLHPAAGGADFDIAWYDADGELILDDRDSSAWQSGTIPPNAASGLIYLVTPPLGLIVPYCIPDPFLGTCPPGVPGEPTTMRFVIEFWCHPE